MQESFLHYVWQFQYFDKKELQTSSGEKLDVFFPGILNIHAGPDFVNAKIRMGGMDWAGCIEIHVQASGWIDHRHDTDPAYENVILHVVWQNDKAVSRSDGTLMPTLELKDRIAHSLIKEYRQLINTSFSVPCTKYLPEVDSMILRSMIDKALVQRLEKKAGQVMVLLKQHQGDWQETAYTLLAQNFGFKVNNEPFFQLAQATPYKLLLKHAGQPIQVEALLFGQAGFLDIEAGDDYYQLLRREYNILSKKYGLSEKKLKRAQWRFLRLRPANFPTLRLAQWSALIIHERNLFSKIFQVQDVASQRAMFTAGPTDYWRTHYRFNKKCSAKMGAMGDSSVDNILVNSIAPLLVAYGKQTDTQSMVDRAIDLLVQLPPEENSVTNTWQQLGVPVKNAFDSQGLIELHNSYCQRRNCLNCNIGVNLLKPKF